MILALNSPQARLENTGGKAANLSALIQEDFPVPDGFIITTDAYSEFVEANQLLGRILELLSGFESQDIPGQEKTSQKIRGLFSSAAVPTQLVHQIEDAYRKWGEPAVAVRSSATAEDLPGLSFAGQQETFLNVTNSKALLTAVVNCWSSLWTARAIAYRYRNEIDQTQVSMAVVVQEFIPAEISGVLFTANPLTGSRNEAVVDATYGLGEALVSGKVEPDHYLIDLPNRKIRQTTLGSKKLAIFDQESGGLQFVKQDASHSEALNKEQLFEVIRLGEKVAALFKFPQDIEWAIAEGKLFLLQTRPITSLFPLPEGMSTTPLRMMFSFGSVQGILDPLTPLGQDAIRMIFAGGASIFGFDVTHETQGVIKIAASRLWGDATAVINHPIGSHIIPRIFSVIDPVAQVIYKHISNDPGLNHGQGKLRFSTFRRLAKFAFPMLIRTFWYYWKPQDSAQGVQLASQGEIERFRVRSDQITSLEDSINLFRHIYTAFPYVVPEFVPVIFAGLIPLFLLAKLSEELTGSDELAMTITRGVPHNVTTEMDLFLLDTANKVRSDEQSYRCMLQTSSIELANQYIHGELPETAQSAVGTFLNRYGMRGVGEIDIGRSRWRENPEYVMDVIKSYLQIAEDTLTTEAIFQEGAQEAEEAIVELASIARRTPFGWIKASIIKQLALRVRELSGLRESPKFHIVQMMGIIRESILTQGKQLADSGDINQADDLFYLYLSELENFARNRGDPWKDLIAERRTAYRREKSRVQIPRILLSDGRAFYEGMISQEGNGNRILGSPVSPGIVDGIVKVVQDPLKAELSPGEILVCPGTDPAWTPLFLVAGGLITEVGGMVTHGAIVAREYGIPAVVGVQGATIIFNTGQRILLNGSTGEINILDS